jgi:hypothetical protein
VSTDTDALVVFLRAAILTRRAIAEAVRQPPASPTTAPWAAYPVAPDRRDRRQDRDMVIVGAKPHGDTAGWTACEVGQWDGAEAVADHIVANQPGDVIRRCDADLRIMEDCEKYLGGQDDALMWHASRLAGRILADLADAYGVSEVRL